MAVLEGELSQARSKIKLQNKELDLWKNKYADIADRVREIPLKDVAYELGLEADSSDKHKWQNEHHTINITGSKFFDWKHDFGGGGAIDLVMHVNECDYKQSVAWLNERMGESATIEAVNYKTQKIIKTELVHEFTPPIPEQNRWGSCTLLVIQERAIAI